MQEEVDSDEDEYVYNPLKLPMGPDGKPIPYWLYKLHGLNQVDLVKHSPQHHATPREPATALLRFASLLSVVHCLNRAISEFKHCFKCAT